MKEMWKDIKGYEGLYQISNLGRIKSLEFRNNKINIKREKIKKKQIRNTYEVINLHKNGKIKSFQIHRLVAEAFIPNPNNFKIINHKDFNRVNNVVENLEWCTQKHNVNHAKLKLKKVKQKSKTTKTLEKYIQIKNNHGKLYYRVKIRQLNIDKLFCDFNRAVVFRNSSLKKLEKYYK